MEFQYEVINPYTRIYEENVTKLEQKKREDEKYGKI